MTQQEAIQKVKEALEKGTEVTKEMLETADPRAENLYQYMSKKYPDWTRADEASRCPTLTGAPVGDFRITPFSDD